MAMSEEGINMLGTIKLPNNLKMVQLPNKNYDSDKESSSKKSPQQKPQNRPPIIKKIPEAGNLDEIREEDTFDVRPQK
jgi:hypothetical protein